MYYKAAVLVPVRTIEEGKDSNLKCSLERIAMETELRRGMNPIISIQKVGKIELKEMITDERETKHCNQVKGNSER